MPIFCEKYLKITLQAIVDQRLRLLDKEEAYFSFRFDLPPKARAESIPLV